MKYKILLELPFSSFDDVLFLVIIFQEFFIILNSDSSPNLYFSALLDREKVFLFKIC